jgi:hypothetical protein
VGLRVGLQQQERKNLHRCRNCNFGLLVCNLALLLSVSTVKLTLEILRTVTVAFTALMTCLSKNVTLSYYSKKARPYGDNEAMSVSMNINAENRIFDSLNTQLRSVTA